MPAIATKQAHLPAELIINHYHDSGHTILASNFGHAIFAGFICTQGAKYLHSAKLATIDATAITNGDGSEDSTWKLVPKGDAVYVMIIIGYGTPREQCYVIVDDEGWPMLAGANPPEHLPPEIKYEVGHYPVNQSYIVR